MSQIVNFYVVLHTVEEGETPVTYPYGITSLADKRDFLQKGDIVNFQIAKVKGTEVLRATNLAAQRKYIRAKVDSVKGQVRIVYLSGSPV